MPHKRNPHKTERISGLARIVRSYSIAAMENVPLWHERDISNSAPERIIFPESFTLTDYMLRLFTRIMDELVVFPERMRANLESTHGLVASQRVLLALTEHGMARQDAYKIVQSGAMESWATGEPLQSILGAESDGGRTAPAGRTGGALRSRLSPEAHRDRLHPPRHRRGVTPMDALLTTDLPGLTLFRRGKVRDTYCLADDLLLFVTTDRISAFDVVMPNGIPDKGRVLTGLSRFWFDRMRDLVPNHLVSADVADLPPILAAQRDMLDGRIMIGRTRRADRHRVRRARLPRRFGLGGIPQDAAASRGMICLPA